MKFQYKIGCDTLKIDKIKRIILVLLKDKDIEKEIRKIFNPINNSNLENFNQNQETTQNLKLENEELKDKLDNQLILIKKLENEILSKKDDIEILKNRFPKIDEVYKRYTGLSENTKKSLMGIFKGDTIDRFIFCGVQHENIENLWDYINRELIEGKMEDIDSLKIIFDYFFDAHNLIYESKLYIKQEVAVNDRFDDDLHTRISEGNVKGNITEVLFKGYINCNSNKVSRKSLVKI